MSHYAVAVFSNDPSEDAFRSLLAPYSETDEKYFVFEPVADEEILKEWDRFRQSNHQYGYDQFLDNFYTLRDNQYGHWHNPQAKWDWYILNGREYMYDVPVEERAVNGYYKKSQIRWFEPTDASEEELRDDWKTLSTEGGMIMSAEYFLGKYGTEEQYIKEMMAPEIPYAFISPDGVWHAPGNVGWFAFSDDTAESRNQFYQEWNDFLLNAPDCYVSLVDCHI